MTYKMCSNEEFEQFMEESGNRIVSTVWKRIYCPMEYEDFRQEACIAIAHGLAMYGKKDAVARRTAYIYRCVQNVALQMRRSLSALCRGGILHPPYGLEGEIPDQEFQLFWEDPDERLARMDRHSLLWGAIRTAGLTNMEMTVIQFELADLNQYEIADRLMICQCTVSKLRRSAFQKLRQALVRSGWRLAEESLRPEVVASLDEFLCTCCVDPVPEGEDEVALEEEDGTALEEEEGAPEQLLFREPELV